ncbi:hypothetical protein GF406_20545 [candidate division KSB1 bacterium]|nr:hypothetical protein [candidate division KSB1 bacterium]
MDNDKTFHNQSEIFITEKGLKSQRRIDPIKELMTKKGQIILYGPPGTGKTYNTKKVAIDLLE